MNIFADFDFDDFWIPLVADGSEFMYREINYRIGEPINHEMIKNVENFFGYKLPSSYIEFLKSRNGGMSKKQKFITKHLDDYPYDYITVARFFNIDHKRYLSCLYRMEHTRRFFNRDYLDKKPTTIEAITELLSTKPSVFPNIGIYFGGLNVMCSLDGGYHYSEGCFFDYIAFDYRHCDDNSEPQIVHVELSREDGNDRINIYHIAKNFETFIKGLE